MTTLEKQDPSLLGPNGFSKDEAPPYEVDFGAMTPTTNGSAASLPRYGDVAGSSAFRPTRHLQIQAQGFVCNSWTGHSKDPTFIYEVSADGQHGSEAYVSLRPGRVSNDCTLVRAGDAAETALCSTTYRWGPYRWPRLSLPAHGEEIVVHGSTWNCLSRKTTMKTPWGEFRWRYGGRKERKAEDASNLIVLELQDRSCVTEENKDGWRKVGQLVRNKALRSAGTRRWDSGNGGRLMLDLGGWTEALGKGAAREIELVAVASCLVMLKKEVDGAAAAVASSSNSSAGVAAAVSVS
jgi:hypothetical protein